jgi:predicted N-acetyltransferase YhbS
MISIRPARSDDATEIAHILRAVWPDDTADANRIASVIQPGTHLTVVAESEGRVVGFVDGFMTHSVDQSPRRELDLMAVHTDFHGRGIAKQLIRAFIDSSAEGLTRALIRADNTPAQRALQSCGFQPDNALRALYVASGVADHAMTPQAHIIPVQTFIYRGVWVEALTAPSELKLARTLLAHDENDVVGAVIAQTDTLAIQAAEAAGYELIGNYWWHTFNTFKAGAAPTQP